MAISKKHWATGTDPLDALDNLIKIGQEIPNKYVLYGIAGDDEPVFRSDFKIIHRVGAKVTLLAKFKKTTTGYQVV